MVRKKVVPATVRLWRGVAAAAVSSFILHDLGFVLDTVLAMPHNYFDLGLDHPDRAGTPGSRPPSWQVLNYNTPDVLDEAPVHPDFLEDEGNSQGSVEAASPSTQLLLPSRRAGASGVLASNCESPCFSTRSGRWSSENERSRSPEQCGYCGKEDGRLPRGNYHDPTTMKGLLLRRPIPVRQNDRRAGFFLPSAWLRDGGASPPSRLSETFTFPHLPHYKQTSQSAPDMRSLVDHVQRGAVTTSSSSSGSIWGGGGGQAESSKSAPPLGLGTPGENFACAGLGAGVPDVQDAEWSDSLWGCWSPPRIKSEGDLPPPSPGGLLSRAFFRRGPRAVAGSGERVGTNRNGNASEDSTPAWRQGPLLPATAPTAPTPQSPAAATSSAQPPVVAFHLGLARGPSGVEAARQDQEAQDHSQLPPVPDTPERRPMASPSASPEQRPMASPAGSGIATPGASTREPSPAHTTSHSGDVSTAAEDEADDDDDDDIAEVERDEAAGVAVTPRGRRGLLLPAAFPVDLDAHPPRPVSPEPTRRSSGTYPYNKDGELCSHALETLNSPESYTNTKGGDHRDRPQCDVNASNKPSKKKKKVTGAARHIEHAVTPFGVVAVARNGYGAPQESKASASGSADARKKVNEFTVTPDVLSLKERMNELRKDLASSRMANIERDEEAMGAGKSYRDIWWTPSVRMLTETEVADLLRPDMEVKGVVPTAVEGGLSLLEQLYTTRCTSYGCDREQAEDLLAKVVGGHELLGLADDFADEGEHASGSWEHEQQLRHGRGEHEEHRDLSKVGQHHDLRRSRYSYPVEHEFGDQIYNTHGPSPSGAPARGAGSGSQTNKPLLAGGPELAERVRRILDGVRDLWQSEGARIEIEERRLGHQHQQGYNFGRDDAGSRNWLSSKFKQYHRILVRDIRGLAVMRQIAAPLGHVLAVEKEAYDAQRRDAGVAGGRSPHSRPHYTRAMKDPAAAGPLVRLLQKALERIAEFYREAMAQSEFRHELEAPSSLGSSETSLLREFFPEALIFAYQKLYDAVSSSELAVCGSSGTSISTPSLLQHLPGRSGFNFVRMPILERQSTDRGLHFECGNGHGASCSFGMEHAGVGVDAGPALEAAPSGSAWCWRRSGSVGMILGSIMSSSRDEDDVALPESETPRLSPGLPALLGAPEVMQRRGLGLELDTSRTTAGGPMLESMVALAPAHQLQPPLQYSTYAYAHALGGSPAPDFPEGMSGAAELEPPLGEQGADWDCLSRVLTGLLPVSSSPPIPCPRRRGGLSDFRADESGPVLRGGRPTSTQALQTTRSGGDMAMAPHTPPPLALWRWSTNVNEVGGAPGEGWRLTYNPGDS